MINMGVFIALIDVIPEDTDVDFVKLISKLKKVLPGGSCFLIHQANRQVKEKTNDVK